MPLNIFDLEKVSQDTKELITHTGKFLLSFLHIKKNLNIIIIDENKIKKINGRYRGKDRPTDVLAFNYNDDDLIGEIFLCLKQNKKKALIENRDPNDRLKIIIIHGLLHLLGYDHKTESDNALMEKETLRLFNQLQLINK